MPLFEFRCNGCSEKFTTLVGVVAGTAGPVCPRCGGADLTKLVSRFSTIRSEETALDNLADMANPDDPQSMHKIMREMKGEIGEDYGDDFEELMDSGCEEDYAGDNVI